jgi:hypothetical protein
VALRAIEIVTLPGPFPLLPAAIVIQLAELAADQAHSAVEAVTVMVLDCAPPVRLTEEGPAWIVHGGGGGVPGVGPGVAASAPCQTST